jgi:hypothetical protein
VDGAVQPERRADAELDRAPVQNRQGAGQPEAHGADVGVRLGAELVVVAAEELGSRLQLDVDLEADHRFECGHVS